VVWQAHDIPNDASPFRLLSSLEGAHLRLLVRVPLRAMRDISTSERSAGYLDLKRAANCFQRGDFVWI
jgi:hypothetical protein